MQYINKKEIKKILNNIEIYIQNKVSKVSGGEREKILADSEAIEALASMGYSISEAREALKLVPPDVKDVGKRVMLALKNLGKKIFCNLLC